ncbi:hypothetical protein ACWGDT_36865 [Streptomyces avermitilis]
MCTVTHRDTDAFWHLIETARAADRPLHEAPMGLSAAQGAEAILAFQARADQLDAAVDRRDVWAARNHLADVVFYEETGSVARAAYGHVSGDEDRFRPAWPPSTAGMCGSER